MSVNFPTTLDVFVNPTATDYLNSPSHAGQHANANDILELLEEKVGINSSAVTTSHDYKLSGVTSTAKALSDANLDTDGTLSANSNTKIPSQKAVKTYADTKTTLATVLSTIASDWQSVTNSWTYASATTITVPTGAASLYKKGDKIRLTQTTVKYFYVIGVADTVLTVTGGSDYSITNAAISAISVSHNSNPIGFPAYFNTTAMVFDTAYTDNGTGGQSVSTTSSIFKIMENKVWCFFQMPGTFVKNGSNNLTAFNRAAELPPIAIGLTGYGNFGGINLPFVMNDKGSGACWMFCSGSIADNQSYNSGMGEFTYEI